jgi:predicted metalloprotease with PDZ domain
MRGLWRRSGGSGITEADVREVLHEVAGRPMDQELDAFVHGTAELPLPSLLERFGIAWQAQAPTMPQRLGLRASESALTGVRATHVLRGSAAERAGLCAGDELIAMQGWRLRRLDDVLRVLTPGMPGRLIVSRDQRVLELALVLPRDDEVTGTVSLGVATAAPKPAQNLRKAWVAG